MTLSPAHLIIGGDSQLGQALAQQLQAAGHRVLTTTRRRDLSTCDPNALPLDLAQPDAVQHFPWPQNLGRVYLFAAVTSLRSCRENPVKSSFINTTQAAALAQQTARLGATPVLISTNLVFDGRAPFRTTADPTCPQTAYGQQKVDAERAALAAGGVVIRPTKILPPQPAMLACWRDALQQHQTVEAFDDLWFAPIPLKKVLDAATTAAPGITHLSAARDLTYADAARHIAGRLGVSLTLVRATSAADAGIPPQERPRHTTLQCDRPADPLAVINDALALGDLHRRA